MIISPLPFSPHNGKDKDILNSFNIQISEEICEDIINSDQTLNNFAQCSICKSILTKPVLLGDNSKVSSCVFCRNLLQINSFNYDILEKPHSLTPYYLNLKSKQIENKGKTNVLIVICLDFSGSMIASYKAPTNSQKVMDFQKKKKSEERGYISRKELLLVDLEEELKILFDQDKKFNYQVFFITFSSKVVLFGNGTKQNFFCEMNSQLYNDLEQCKKYGRENASKIFEKNKDSNLEYLFQKLHETETSGVTSLGPAVACGLGVIEALKPDMSQLYVFTDGLANNGIGAMKEEKADPVSLDEQAKITFRNLREIGTDMGTVFHIIGFSDSQCKLNILQNLTEFKGCSFERILIENETYNDAELRKLLQKAMRVSSDMYGIKPKLKLFCNKQTELAFCKKSNNSIKTKIKGDAIVYTKKLVGIGEKEENIACKYNVEEKKVSTIIFQIQLIFSKPSTGQKIFLTANIESPPQKFQNYNDIDLNATNLILMNDEFHLNENLCQKYIEMIYLCKYYGEKNKKPSKTFKEAEFSLKNYIYKCFGENNMKMFEEAEAKAKAAYQEDDEEATINRRNFTKKKVTIAEENNKDDDETTIRVKKNKTFAEEEFSINVKKKKNEDQYKKSDLKGEKTIHVNKNKTYEEEFESINIKKQGDEEETKVSKHLKKK